MTSGNDGKGDLFRTDIASLFPLSFTSCSLTSGGGSEKGVGWKRKKKKNEKKKTTTMEAGRNGQHRRNRPVTGTAQVWVEDSKW